MRSYRCTAKVKKEAWAARKNKVPGCKEQPGISYVLGAKEKEGKKMVPGFAEIQSIFLVFQG
jgi:hypothetical protein